MSAYMDISSSDFNLAISLHMVPIVEVMSFMNDGKFQKFHMENARVVRTYVHKYHLSSNLF